MSRCLLAIFPVPIATAGVGDSDNHHQLTFNAVNNAVWKSLQQMNPMFLVSQRPAVGRGGNISNCLIHGIFKSCRCLFAPPEIPNVSLSVVVVRCW